MKKKAANLLKTVLLILVLCIPILQFRNGVDVQAATKLATPKLVSAKAQGTSKIKVSWKKVSGAGGYKIYRKSYWDERWKEIKTVSKNTVTFTDTKIKPGMYYSYTVRAVKNKTVLSGYNKKGVYAVTSLGYPADLEARIMEDNIIEISWKDIPLSSGYLIYRRTEGSSWKMIEDCGTNNWFEDYSLKGGIQYYYTVRPYVEYDKVYKGSYDKNGVKAPIINPISSGLKFKVNERMLCKQGTFLLELEDYNGDMNNIIWNSSDSSVATVDSQGRVKGINYGETIITATAYGKTCECKIKVVTFAQVNKTDYILSKAETINIKWAEHNDKGFTYYYHIEDTNVLNCSWEEGHYEEGYYVCGLTVTPRTNGTTNITITNSFNDESVILYFTVKDVKVLSANEENLTISKKTTINIHNTIGGAMKYEIENLGIVTCEWGEWGTNHNCPLYITPQSNGRTNIVITDEETQDVITITITVTGLKNDISDNYGKLQNYIETNGYTNSSGNQFIKYTRTVQGIETTFAIIYEKLQNRFRFMMLWRQSGINTVSNLFIYPSDNPVIYAEHYWNLEDEQIFATKSIKSYASSYAGGNLVFDIMQTTGEIPALSIKQQSQKSINVLCSGCNLYLLNPIGINLKKLGFYVFS